MLHRYWPTFHLLNFHHLQSSNQVHVLFIFTVKLYNSFLTLSAKTMKTKNMVKKNIVFYYVVSTVECERKLLQSLILYESIYQYIFGWSLCKVFQATALNLLIEMFEYKSMNFRATHMKYPEYSIFMQFDLSIFLSCSSYLYAERI